MGDVHIWEFTNLKDSSVLLRIIDSCTPSFDYGTVVDVYGYSTCSNNYLNAIHAIGQTLLLVNHFLTHLISNLII